MNKKWWKISISHVEMKMKIVALKINSWEKKNIEEKKKAQKANMTEKKPVMRFCTHDIWEKKIESKWTMLFCCKLALAEKKIPKEKKAKIEISTKKSQFAWEVKLKLQIVVELCAFQPNFIFIFPLFSLV